MSPRRGRLLLVTGLALVLVGRARGDTLAAEIGQPTTDRYGDPLPPGAVARLGTVRFRCGGEVLAVAFAPWGKTLASGSADGTLRLWDVATGRELRRFPAEASEEYAFGTYAVHTVAFSPDGNRLATGGGDATVRLWEVATGKEIWRAEAERPGHIGCVAFSPDGRLLAWAISSDPVVRLLEAATGKEVRQLLGHREGVNRLAFAPDGNLLASGGKDRTIRLWEVKTGEERRRIAVPGERGLSGVAFSPDGRVLASSVWGDSIRFWDAATGKPLRQGAGPPEWFNAIAFAAGGRVLASAGNGVRLWEVDTGKPVRAWAGAPGHPPACIAFSPDGRTLASGDPSGAIQLWDTATGQQIGASRERPAAVRRLAFAPDGRTLASRDPDQTIRLWEVATGREVGRFGKGLRPERWALAPPLAILADGKTLLAADSDGTVRHWDMNRGLELSRLPGRLNQVFAEHPHWTRVMAFSPDWKTLACSNGEDPFCLLDVGTGRLLHPHGPIREQSTWTLAFSPDGQTLATGSLKGSAVVQLWDLRTGRELRRFTDHEGAVGSLAFSPDGRFVASAGLNEEMVRLWAVGTVQEVRRFGWHAALPPPSKRIVGHDGCTALVAFSPDGRTLAVADPDRLIHIWEVASGQERRRLAGHRGRVEALAFAPDGRRLASADNAATLVWDFAVGAEGRPQRAEALSQERLQAWWADLAGDASGADRAIWGLAAAPRQAVPFLVERLRPAADPGGRVARLIADLDSEQFAVREKATRELEGLAELALPGLRQALADQPSAEVRRRIRLLLDGADHRAVAGERLRSLRAVEVLEHAGTPEAVRLLQALAKGAGPARLTQEAKRTLERLAQRPS
jgi:WD40 repeat protein